MKRVKESGTVHRWTELNRKELPNLINNPFSFIDNHILASDVGPRFVNPMFYSFHNFFLLASMKRKFQVFSQNRLCASHFFPYQYYNETRPKFILCQGSLKQSFLNLQLVIRQQGQEFDKQFILLVNWAAVAVSGKSSLYINYYKCHNSNHNSNDAYSFSSFTSFSPQISS